MDPRQREGELESQEEKRESERGQGRRVLPSMLAFFLACSSGFGVGVRNFEIRSLRVSIFLAFVFFTTSTFFSKSLTSRPHD